MLRLANTDVSADHDRVCTTGVEKKLPLERILAWLDISSVEILQFARNHAVGTVNKVYCSQHKAKDLENLFNNRLIVHLVVYGVLTKYTSNSGRSYVGAKYNP